MNEYWRPHRNSNITSHLHFQKSVSPVSEYTSVIPQVHFSMVCFGVQVLFCIFPSKLSKGSNYYSKMMFDILIICATDTI